MPELPEVETVRRGLADRVVGRTIEHVEVGRERSVRRTSARQVVDGLTGATVLEADRRGKYLLLPLDTGDTLMVHLRMSGQLLLAPAGTPRLAHTHVVMALAGEPAEELDLGSFLLLGRGEDAAGGREKPSILSDALEAVLGAVYVDGGPDQAYALVERLIGPRLAQTASHLDHLDHKSRLQEQVASEGGPPPEYVTRAEGPDHAKRFFAAVVVAGRVIGEGTGRSKKAAEQSAAAAACATLDAANVAGA